MKSKRTYFKGILFLPLIMAGLLLCAFIGTVREEDCLKQVRKLYRQLNDEARSMKEGIYYLNYQVVSKMNRKGTAPSTSEVEIYSNRQRMFLISDRMEVYRDSKAMVHVMPLQKKIFLYDGVKVDEKMIDNGLQKQMLINDSLFNYCTVSECSAGDIKHSDAGKTVRLVVSEAGVKKFHITNIEFSLAPGEQAIRECTFQYDAGYPVKEIRTTIKKCSYDFKTDKLNYSALEMVFKKDNSLQDRFKGYTLIDNRNNPKITREEKQVAYNRMKKAAGDPNKSSNGVKK